MRKLADIKGLIIDLDGVLWRGRTFLEGVPEFFLFLRTKSMQFLLVTNNSTATPKSVVDRMDGAGVRIDPDEVLKKIMSHYSSRATSQTTIDGIGMEFGDMWRFNLRKSNTEPVVRLNVESFEDKEYMKSRTEEILKLIDED